MIIKMIDGSNVYIKDVYEMDTIFSISNIIKTNCGDEFGHYVEDYIIGLLDNISYTIEDIMSELKESVEDIDSSYIKDNEVKDRLEVIIDDLKLLLKEYNK